MSRRPVELSERDIERVKAFAGLGLAFQTTANRMGMKPGTLASALSRQGLGIWMETAFPKRQGKGGGNKKAGPSEGKCEIRRLKPEQIEAPLVVPNNVQTQWLTKRWAA